jgi:predicted nucleotide-binding protein (sugar kinase/HSP70/actin superfamily)
MVMAVAETFGSLEALQQKLGRFDVSGRILLIPEMNPFASRLLAASFRAFGVSAQVMETYTGLAWGKEFTSGKECFPCQITLGDILEHLHQEKQRLGVGFSADRYVYFLPEADGPCRFGMYNKMQRFVLDRFEEFRDIPIAYLSTQDSYSVAGLLPAKEARYFRRLAYLACISADVLERVVWRVRPYELRHGMTDAFMDRSLTAMASLIETVGAKRHFHHLFALLEDITATARTFIDTEQPRRPRIGIVGEIYLRCHPQANQQIIREIERLGGEVVNATLGEWVNYISFETARRLRRDLLQAWQKREFRSLPGICRQWLEQEIEKLYQIWRQQQAYRRAWRHLNIQPDHQIATIEKWLDNNHLFHFDIGTEAALSIGGALEYAHDGFDGVVNVYPFTCMPSTICSAILKPLLHQERIPYLDASFDGTSQPNHEAVLRTFMYQAKQHQHQGNNGKASSL